jgi:TRAP-type C4-dicarboxylate transport system permease small subunit
VVWVLVMMLLTTSDVITRYFLAWPVPGTVELNELMLGVFAFLGIAYTQQVGGHVRVTIFVSWLPPQAGLVLDIIATFLSLIVASLLAWQGWAMAIHHFDVRTVTDALRIPIYPFWLLLSAGAFLLCLELLINLIAPVRRLVKR